jgi:DNA-binding transcriptional LysR family regulator
MDRFHLLEVFVAVADAESFAGGSRRLGLSAPAVTRAVAALESRLGVKLLARTTRLVRVTEAGVQYLEQARRILLELDEADDAASGIHGLPRGHLSVTAPALFGQMYVMPQVVNYLSRYPDMTVSTLLLDRVVNLLEEGMDVGIRIGELPDSSLRAIPVGSVRRVVCATPDYLTRHGTPQTPAELTGHTIIATNTLAAHLDWAFTRDAKPYPVRLNPRLSTSSNESAISAALTGFGVIRQMSYQVAPHLASGQLVALLINDETAPLPIHVLHREGRHVSARVRCFVDVLVAGLRENEGLKTR